MRDTDKSRYFAITEFNNSVCFIIRSPSLFAYFNHFETIGKLNFKIEKQITNKNGRHIILGGMFADTRLVLVNIYVPNDANQQVFSFFKNYNINLREYAEETSVGFCRLSRVEGRG